MPMASSEADRRHSSSNAIRPNSFRPAWASAFPIQASTTAQGTPQIQYENTGLNVDVEPRMLEGDRISVQLKIDLTAVVRNDNILTPTFVQRSVNDVVNVRSGDPTLLVSVTQHEGLLPALPRTGSKPGDLAGGNFVIVLTARLVD